MLGLHLPFFNKDRGVIALLLMCLAGYFYIESRPKSSTPGIISTFGHYLYVHLWNLWIVDTSVAAGILIGYIVILPLVRKRKLGYLFLKMSVTLIIIELFLDVATSAVPKEWNLNYIVYMLRIGNTLNGAHESTYLTVPLLCFLTFLVTKDEFFSLLYGALMVSIHEGLWFVCYFFSYPIAQASLDENVYIPFIILISSFFITFVVVYRQYLRKEFILPILVYIGYLIWWETLGFPITVTSNNFVSKTTFAQTVWYHVLWVNQVEDWSWFIIFAAMLVYIVWVARSTRVSPPTPIRVSLEEGHTYQLPNVGPVCSWGLEVGVRQPVTPEEKQSRQ